MNKDSLIFVAGHTGLVGSAIVRELQRCGHQRLKLCTRAELDLRRQQEVESFFEREKPEYVFLAAAKVGGIHANSNYPADFIRDNLQIQINVIDAASRWGTKKLCFLGSSCIYPKLSIQPIREEALLTGPLEPTNEPYAIAKIAGIKMCQAYRRQYGLNAISLMPTNLYGPGDNFDLENAHVLPALIRRFHEAKVNGAQAVIIWGTGSPRREFLHVDDLANAAVYLMLVFDGDEPINVGCGDDLTVRELATLVSRIVGFDGEIVQDTGRPDGTPRKLLDITRILSLGWKPEKTLEHGIRETYSWYLANVASARR